MTIVALPPGEGFEDDLARIVRLAPDGSPRDAVPRLISQNFRIPLDGLTLVRVRAIALPSEKSFHRSDYVAICSCHSGADSTSRHIV